LTTLNPPPELETTSAESLEEIKKAYEPSCFKCAHFQTCFIWRDLNNVLRNSLPPDNKQQLPIKIDDLAKICFQYYAKKDA
jgi:hypothetical protein